MLTRPSPAKGSIAIANAHAAIANLCAKELSSEFKGLSTKMDSLQKTVQDGFKGVKSELDRISKIITRGDNSRYRNEAIGSLSALTQVGAEQKKDLWIISQRSYIERFKTLQSHVQHDMVPDPNYHEYLCSTCKLLVQLHLAAVDH